MHPQQTLGYQICSFFFFSCKSGTSIPSKKISAAKPIKLLLPPEVTGKPKVQKSGKKPTSHDKNKMQKPKSKVQAKGQLVVAIKKMKKRVKTG